MKQSVEIVFGLLISTNLYAASFGVCDFGKELLPTMICYGSASLKETTITGDVKVAGPLKASYASMGSLMTDGIAELENTTVNGEADIAGYLKATSVEFEKNLSIAANNVMLHHSTIKGSLQMSSNEQKPSVKLECGSTVLGSVTFTDAPGVVQITEDSIITGKIHNGVVQKLNVKCPG